MGFQFEVRHATVSNEGLLDKIRSMFNDIKSKVKWMRQHLQAFKTLKEDKLVDGVHSNDLYYVIDSSRVLTRLLIKLSTSPKPLDLRKEITENMTKVGIKTNGSVLTGDIRVALGRLKTRQTIKELGYMVVLRSMHFPRRAMWYANDFIMLFSETDDLSVLKAAAKGIKKVALKPTSSDTKQVVNQLKNVWEYRRQLMEFWYDQLKDLL